VEQARHGDSFVTRRRAPAGSMRTAVRMKE
jgi:hypothetical protein